MRSVIHAPALCLSALCTLLPQAQAYELYTDEGTSLQAELKAGYGWFGTRYNYIGEPGRTRWREGFAKFGLRGSTERIGAGQLYGALQVLSSATWGDGDPGGFTTGRERRTAIEEAFVGWRSGALWPTLGQDGLDVSAGRQIVQVGSGFLIKDDGVNPGRGLEDGFYDRGGAYYFGQRQAFARTAVLRLGGLEGLHGTAAWLHSDNRLQAKTELAAGTLDYTGALGTVGLTYIRVLGVDERYAIDQSRLDRRGMKVYTIRADGSAGIENADFAAEYAYQTKRSGNDYAWFAEATYTFAQAPWKPAVSARHTHYSQDFDSLFQGGFRGRYQGEIASNYAFSYNFNMRISDVALTVQPTEDLTVTLMYFNYRSLKNRDVLNLDAEEIALYADWAVTDHVMISPIVGVYKPRKYEGNGGNQSGSAQGNPYFKLMFTAQF